MRLGDPTVGLESDRGLVGRRVARAAGRWARIRIAAVVFAAVLVATACRRPMPETDVGADGSGIPGCWQVDVVADDAPGDSTPSELAGASLPLLRLDTVRVEIGAESRDQVPIFEAGSYDGARLESQPFSAWRRLPADSLLVYRPGALAGYTLRLAPDDGGFLGTLTSYTDAMEPGRPSQRTAPVRATPTSCPPGGSTVDSSSSP
jgi:hypothetical protein